MEDAKIKHRAVKWNKLEEFAFFYSNIPHFRLIFAPAVDLMYYFIEVIFASTLAFFRFS